MVRGGWFSRGAAHGDVPQGTSDCPVTTAGLTEMPRLGQVVIVVVAELRVLRAAARAFLRLASRRRPGVLRGTSSSSHFHSFMRTEDE